MEGKKKLNLWQLHCMNPTPKRGAKSVFNPSPDFLEASKQEYFSNGGKIHLEEIAETDVTDQGYYAHEFLTGDA